MFTKKALWTILFTFCYISIVFAGPFGLEMGMTLKEIGGEVTDLGSGKYKIVNVPKPHSSFEYYYIQVSPKGGLCWIKAIGKDISTSNYGIELKSKFENMEKKLEAAYGKHKKYDFLMVDSIWDRPNDWMMGLIQKERNLIALWDEENSSTLPNNLSTIYLKASATSRDIGFISIEYGFTNMEACEKEISEKEDGNL